MRQRGQIDRYAQLGKFAFDVRAPAERPCWKRILPTAAVSSLLLTLSGHKSRTRCSSALSLSRLPLASVRSIVW